MQPRTQQEIEKQARQVVEDCYNSQADWLWMSKCCSN